jgi:hypothetical protein
VLANCGSNVRIEIFKCMHVWKYVFIYLSINLCGHVYIIIVKFYVWMNYVCMWNSTVDNNLFRISSCEADF